jgi:hypothetical protein
MEEHSEDNVYVYPNVEQSFSEKFSVNIIAKNYKKPELQKLNQASLLLEDVFNSEEYREEVLNFTSFRRKAFQYNRDQTNEQIYLTIIWGAEILDSRFDREMDLIVQMYHAPFSKTVGYTYWNEPTVYTNKKYHRRFTPCEVASNLVHEWMHKLGYSHSVKWEEKRDFTVPYGHNEIIKKLCPLAEQGKLTPLYW